MGDCAGDNPGDVITCDRATVCVLSRASDFAGNRSDRYADDSERIGRTDSGKPVSVRRSPYAQHRRCRGRHRPARAKR